MVYTAQVGKAIRAASTSIRLKMADPLILHRLEERSSNQMPTQQIDIHNKQSSPTMVPLQRHSIDNIQI